jgi:DNA-binding transcriptional LysR family regulator
VVRSGSFAAAAEQLNSIISKHIKHLERPLSAPLNRIIPSLSLTEIGKTYHEFCIRILTQIEHEREAAGLQNERAVRCSSWSPSRLAISSSAP